jgi:pimeloyl-ACP methyl ester carboxylesterase
MQERNVTIQSGDAVLAGTYVIPDGDGPFPAALIIAGSGPLDRNGNHGKLPLSVSRLLSEIVVPRGWATLRFDKRGVGESTGDYLSTGLQEEFDDARSALAWLREQPEVSTVVPVGHSVGALVASEMAAWDDTAGAVLLAYTVQNGQATLEWQAREIAQTVPGWLKGLLGVFGSSIEKQQAKAIRKLRSTTGDVERIGGQRINAKWMREFLDYDPEPALRDSTVPLLALTGSKDIQVDPDDLAAVDAVAGDRATTVLAPDVDHILRHESAELSNPKRYKSQAAKPIDPSVSAALTSWLDDLVDSQPENRATRNTGNDS